MQRILYLCFIDYSKAFDCISHQYFENLMEDMGFPGHGVKLISTLYQDQEFSVRTSIGDSEWFQIGRGIIGEIIKRQTAMAQNSYHVVNPSDVTIEDKIGEGGFGEVYSAIWRMPDGHGTKIKVAMKRIADAEKTNEIIFLSRIRHANILSYFGSYQEMTSLIMITELAEGDLATFLARVSSLPPPVIDRLIKEAAYGLQYLHECGLVHCDVKTQNYLLMADKSLKLGDFGLAKQLDKTLSTVAKGTIKWMAPEVFAALKRSKRSDVYSYGMVVWSICSTEVPFASWMQLDVMNAVKEGQRPVIPGGCHPLFRSVIETCWQMDYKNRPTMDMVVQTLHTGK
ncbi:uncharacterized protein [Amphiura filiformis]|uniref:uncharacterized protein n=1 Tax=Amphiura filiformis TaxID=82378 RepID=UPI003B20C876